MCIGWVVGSSYRYFSEGWRCHALRSRVDGEIDRVMRREGKEELGSAFTRQFGSKDDVKEG